MSKIPEIPEDTPGGGIQQSSERVRIGGRLHELIEFRDASGEIIKHMVQPLKLEFYPRDVMQVIVGAMLLAIPVGFTEEVWTLARSLSTGRIAAVATLSFLFLALFTFFTSYRTNRADKLFDVFRNGHGLEYVKRVLTTYAVALLIAGLFLALIDKANWFQEPIQALRLTILVAFPASMSAAVADAIK